MIQVSYPHFCNKKREKSKLYHISGNIEEKEIDKCYLLNILPANINICCLDDRKCQQKLTRADIFFHYTFPNGLIFLFLELVGKLL